MYMSTSLSVIVPVYNTEPALLDRAVWSVLEQEEVPVELLLIDDCSSRIETLGRLKVYSTVGGVRIIHNSDNLGVSGSRNIGIREASGEFIAFLDHDDFLRKDFAKTMVSNARQHHSDMVVCGWEAVDSRGKVIRRSPEDERFFDSPWFIWASSLIWTHIYRREVLLKENIFFPAGCYMEDSVFSLKCADRVRNVSVSHSSGYVHFQNDQSASHSDWFHSLKMDQMPFDYLEEIVRKVQNPEYTIGTAAAMLPLFTCVQTACSDRRTQNEAVKRAKMILRDCPGSLKKAYHYFKNVPVDPRLHHLTMGYLTAAALHLDALYCRAARALFRRTVK